MYLTAVRTQKLFIFALRKNQAFNVFGQQTCSFVRADITSWAEQMFTGNAGFRLEQASGGRAATIIRIRCMHDYSAEYEYTIRPTIRTE